MPFASVIKHIEETNWIQLLADDVGKSTPQNHYRLKRIFSITNAIIFCERMAIDLKSI